MFSGFLGVVAEWLCGFVALWSCGFVALRFCGCVTLLLGDFILLNVVVLENLRFSCFHRI